MKHRLLIVLFFLLLTALAAKKSFELKDAPWDDGKALQLSWTFSFVPDSVSAALLGSDGSISSIIIPAKLSGMITISDLDPDLSYTLNATVFQGDELLSYTSQGNPREQWFYLHKLAFLVLLLMICFAIIYYITAARHGKDFFIRRIAGLDSMEEAIGRATEKGKPILFVPGIGDLDDIQTIASLTILSHLAQRSAEYNTELIVPCRFSMVLSAAREVVKEAYMKAGRVDAYKPDSVFYLTDDQFGYVAGIDGIMLREKPAANFFLGSFYAESLILAETGFSTGAIQTAGTAQAHQLPFFVVSCDYTLIGEELFAASAYLSRDPQQLGSLKGHDFGKLLVILLIIIGVILEIAGISNLKEFIAGSLS